MLRKKDESQQGWRNILDLSTNDGWRQNKTSHVCLDEKRYIECMKFLKRMLIYFESIYKKKLRNRLCKNKEDIFFYIGILRKV